VRYSTVGVGVTSARYSAVDCWGWGQQHRGADREGFNLIRGYDLDATEAVEGSGYDGLGVGVNSARYSAVGVGVNSALQQENDSWRPEQLYTLWLKRECVDLQRKRERERPVRQRKRREREERRARLLGIGVGRIRVGADIESVGREGVESPCRSSKPAETTSHKITNERGHRID
jgi:hypothetical protein